MASGNNWTAQNSSIHFPEEKHIDKMIKVAAWETRLAKVEALKSFKRMVGGLMKSMKTKKLKSELM